MHPTESETMLDDAPVAEGYQRIENREIARIYAGLRELSGRRLDGPNPVKKVRALLARFRGPAQFIEDEKEKIIREHPAPEGWDGEKLPIAINEERAALINDLMRETQDIREIPKAWYLCGADMPKPIKGELGDQNQFGVADIQHNLGFLFDCGDEEEMDGTRAED